MAVCIPLGIWNGQPCLFAFCLLISFQLTQKNVTVGAYFNITVGYLLSSEDLPMHHNNINLNKTFAFKFTNENSSSTHLVFWITTHLSFLWLSLSFLWLCFIFFRICLLFCPLLWCNCCICANVPFISADCKSGGIPIPFMPLVSCWCGRFRRPEHTYVTIVLH